MNQNPINLSHEQFLTQHLDPIPWSMDGTPQGMVPKNIFLGKGDYGLEVATVEANARPRVHDVRTLWNWRHGNRPSPVLLVVFYPSSGTYKAMACGPMGEDPPVFDDVEFEHVENLCLAALQEPDRHAAIRLLSATLPEMDAEPPGVRNAGMFATHELRTGVPQRSDWEEGCRRGQALLQLRGRRLVEGLGFEIEALAGTVSVLRVLGTKRAVAVFLQDDQPFESIGPLFNANSPVTYAMGHAEREGLPWVVLTRGSQIRVYSARTDVGVGRKGREETFVELNLTLMPQQSAGYLSLLASAEALAEGGTFAEILESSGDYAAELGGRLRERVYHNAVPALATAIAKAQAGTVSEADLPRLYEQALITLFRILFVAYAEDKDLLPYRTNGRYQHHALKSLAKSLAEARIDGRSDFDEHATDLWQDVLALWHAVRSGNSDWGVPAYNGELFSNDPSVNAAGAAIYNLTLSNAQIGSVLMALLVDEGHDGVIGPVDFRSLSVREFGTIYEGLLESSLSVAPAALTVDRDGNYLPADEGASVVVEMGEVYFHNRSGARKSTGSYFTKPFAVEHLLDHALEPALKAHLKEIEQLAEQGDEAAVSERLFDFRCVDLAMGSGHFLVAAVDRIEARLSAFLAHHPVAQVQAELERLRTAAITRLGELADGVEIEHASLLRRQVARRCVYGVDLNPIAVELARLSIWIHTFVPGLPLSFLDHNLVHGDSLTGIGTVDEALEALAPDQGGGINLFRKQIEEFLGRAQEHLQHLARISGVSLEEAEEARQAHLEALEAVEPARRLFDLLIAVRLDEAARPMKIMEEAISQHRDLKKAEQHAKELNALHFPIAFPEVFIREKSGFDCILGNPPWDEATVEELGFWALYHPGLKSLNQAKQRRKIAELKRQRPDLVAEYERQIAETERLRELLLAGPYPGMGTGDPDLYKAFCWRFWNLACEDGGRIGVVLPRSVLAAQGSTKFRQHVFARAESVGVTILLNNKQWFFDDVHPQYTIGLVAIARRKAEHASVTLRGPYPSFERYRGGMARLPAVFSDEEIQCWNDTASLPLLPTEESVEVFAQLRKAPRLNLDDGEFWHARPHTELHATNDKGLMDLKSKDCPPGFWPVFKGASFDLWMPDTGTYYAWADPKVVVPHLQVKRERGRTRRNSVWSEFALGQPNAWWKDEKTLPCWQPRIAFRDVSRSTDTRTVRVALVPPEVFITNKGPYLLWPRGDVRDEAYLLGVLSSVSLDWYARRFVEINMNFYIFNPFPVPRPPTDYPLRRRTIELAGRLAARDERFAVWAKNVGVACGPLSSEEKQDMIHELDAVVAHLYGLTEKQLIHIFETFHEGWDYTERLVQVLKYYHRLQRGLNRA